MLWGADPSAPSSSATRRGPETADCAGARRLAAARREAEAEVAPTSRGCLALVAPERSPPHGGRPGHPCRPGECPRGVRPAGCPGAGHPCPAPCPRSPGTESCWEGPRAGAASMFVFVCRVCAPARLSACVLRGLGVRVCVCGVCVCGVSVFLCACVGGVMSACLPACVCMSTVCVILRVYIYLCVCVCISEGLCLGVRLSACACVFLVCVCSSGVVCMTGCLKYEGLHMVLKACVCLPVPLPS